MAQLAKSFVVLGVGAFALLAAPVAGQAQETGRYQMEKTGQGYVRLDTKTGEMSICNEQAGQLVCKLAAGERRAFEDELASLSERVKKLEDVLAANGTRTPPSREALPSEEEFEKTMGYMERFFRRFMDIIEEFQKEESVPDTPQRT
ncbi:MAG: hypothetical protein ACRECW_15440 [Phyllobacterium sp.]